MTIFIDSSLTIGMAATEPRQKKAYMPPTLTLFGQVATLTQSGSACGDNDSASCTTPAGNMGPMP